MADSFVDQRNQNETFEPAGWMENAAITRRIRSVSPVVFLPIVAHKTGLVPAEAFARA